MVKDCGSTLDAIHTELNDVAVLCSVLPERRFSITAS